MKKFFLPIILVLISLCFSIFLASCDTDDDEQVVGSWYGTRAYYNPVGGTKYQYLTVIFEANGTGSLEYETPSSYSYAKFKYSVKNNTITCNGAYANTDGDVETDFHMTLRIEGNRLIPVDKYSMFILTKDNSIMTDGNGDEITDKSNLLYGVWLYNSGKIVLVLDESYFTEYTLMSSSSKIYSKKTEGSFSFNQAGNFVFIDGYRYDIMTLTESSLQLKSQSGVISSYNRGSESDIPTNGENSTDYRSILENAVSGWSDKKGNVIMRFYDFNKVTYIEKSSETFGSFGYIHLMAYGTYSFSGKTINCTFTDVSWQGGDSSAKNYFPGWKYMETCKKDFIINSLNVEVMSLTRDGKNYTLYNLNK